MSFGRFAEKTFEDYVQSPSKKVSKCLLHYKIYNQANNAKRYKHSKKHNITILR